MKTFDQQPPHLSADRARQEYQHYLSSTAQDKDEVLYNAYSLGYPLAALEFGRSTLSNVFGECPTETMAYQLGYYSQSLEYCEQADFVGCKEQVVQSLLQAAQVHLDNYREDNPNAHYRNKYIHLAIDIYYLLLARTTHKMSIDNDKNLHGIVKLKLTELHTCALEKETAGKRNYCGWLFSNASMHQKIKQRCEDNLEKHNVFRMKQ